VNHPFLSVIVPAHQGARVLRQSLAALRASDLPSRLWELIVVDDASTDETSLVAAEYADTLVRLACKPRGPAYARNRGAEAARGDILVFIDADVCVHHDTLRRFADLFRSETTVAAAFGSYDARPPALGIVSQFRNLMHHYVHHRNPGDAETFWAGCGAVRRDAFFDVGGFNEWHYPRPQIEDIELGRRLRMRGHRIVLRPEIQGAHLKRWTFRNGIVTDFRHRGVPWMWLILAEGPNPAGGALNLRAVEKICTALVGFMIAALATAAFLRSTLPLTAAAAALAGVLALNHDFYRFFIRTRGPLFALAVIPLHLAYYTISGIAVFAGILLRQLFGEPVPPGDAVAQADSGIATWPPPPNRPALNTFRVRRP